MLILFVKEYLQQVYKQLHDKCFYFYLFFLYLIIFFVYNTHINDCLKLISKCIHTAIRNEFFPHRNWFELSFVSSYVHTNPMDKCRIVFWALKEITKVSKTLLTGKCYLAHRRDPTASFSRLSVWFLFIFIFLEWMNITKNVNTLNAELW